MRFFCLYYTLIALAFASNALATCNFKTGDYIEKINNPDQISLIEIYTPNYKDYTSNFFKIITSKDINIPQNLKKKFKARVLIKYKFGECEYLANIRQHGDQRDHLEFGSNSSILRSLDISLIDGNLAGAVKFKLLLPNTRNGPNEILASLILKKFGFIAPETFEVNTDVNGSKSIMLFQEKATKELLEKNLYREGPIFEGDEDLIWGYEGHDDGSLTPLSLSRMVNSNWFSKGKSSQNISLKAFTELQSSYLDYSMNPENREYLILRPNGSPDELFDIFYLSILAMNGHHALNPFNRKYYYDSFEGKFIPIYYDGTVKFMDIYEYLPKTYWEKLLSKFFISEINTDFYDNFKSILYSETLKRDFENRIKSKNIDTYFFNTSISIYLNNINEIIKLLNNTNFINVAKPSKNENINSYLNFQNTNNIKQNLINSLIRIDDNYKVKFIDNKIKTLSEDEVRDVISKNIFENSRTVLINNNYKFFDDINHFEKLYPDFPGKIFVTNGVKIDYDSKGKTITFKQSNNDDWVLLDSSNLNDWKITFFGVIESSKSNLSNEQRFNNYNLTGCLTIRNSEMNNVDIYISNGTCEDSLNIIKSYGIINNIIVDNSYQDSVDLDFSSLNISNIEVKNSGNDCVDVSGGNYVIKSVKVESCFDKGISVGEKSNFKSDMTIIKKSNIGISSKDFSSTILNFLDASDVNFCAEVLKKKQEFGGARLEIINHNCFAMFNVDENSNYLTNKNDF